MKFIKLLRANKLYGKALKLISKSMNRPGPSMTIYDLVWLEELKKEVSDFREDVLDTFKLKCLEAEICRRIEVSRRGMNVKTNDFTVINKI